MLKIYTSTLWVKSKNTLDITIKTGNKAFAPTWGMVMDYKNNLIDERQYTQLYINRMRSSYIKNRIEWERLLSKEEVILTCYCPKGTFCHRYILADILEKIGAKYLGEL